MNSIQFQQNNIHSTLFEQGDTVAHLKKNNPAIIDSSNKPNKNYNANSNLIDDRNRKSMASMSVSSSSSTTTSSPILENYLLDLKKVIEWLVTSESQLSNQSEIGNDVNAVKQQFQTHEVGYV